MRERVLPLFLLAVGVLGALLSLSGNQPVKAQPPTSCIPWSCSLDDIGATLTECIPSRGSMGFVAMDRQTLWIDSVVAQSTTATGGLFILRTGRAANCGTATASFLPSSAAVARLSAPANTAPPTVITLKVPLPIPPDPNPANEHPRLCVLGVATNTFTGQISGCLQ